jgi:hypothetical protein
MTALDLRRPVVLALVLCVGTAAGAQDRAVLRNDDVVKMTRADLPTSVILTTIDSAKVHDFDVSIAGLLALKDAGVAASVISAMQSKAARAAGSDALVGAKDQDTILQLFKTMTVDASRATFFANDQMVAALHVNKEFEAFGIVIVDNPANADVVLEVGYTFAWDYPFTLKKRNTGVFLLSGIGTGPFSGPLGAESVASELVKLLKPYRTTGKPAR